MLLRPECGKTMKKNGTTSSDKTRWRYKDSVCGFSMDHVDFHQVVRISKMSCGFLRCRADFQ